MTEYSSKVASTATPADQIYTVLSDLTYIQKLKDRIPAEALESQKIPTDQIKNFSFDSDSVTVELDMVGAIKLHIIERTPNSCIKLETENSPIAFNLWIQIKQQEEMSFIKVTFKGDIPMMVKAMIGNKLQDGLDKIADVLAQIPYQTLI